MASLMVDFIISLDAYGGAEGWPGFWGMEGPEYLAFLGGGSESEHIILMARRRTSFLAQRTSGAVVLVGHSYGGFVITNAATGADNVRALVFVDALIADEGETVFSILGGSGSAFDIPDPSAVFDVAGYPGAPEGDAEAFPQARHRGPGRGPRRAAAAPRRTGGGQT